MKNQTGKRLLTLFMCAIIVLSHFQSVTAMANAEECPIHGTHKLDGTIMFEGDHPHKQYIVCDCGFVQYTGTTLDYYENCETCKAQVCPVHGTHKLDGTVMFEGDHPHKQYTVCDCGFVQYTGTTLDYYEECEICNPQECQHLTTDIGWDTITNKRSVSDTEHELTGYQYRYCTVCFQHIGDKYLVTETVPHDFDDAGDCPTCGYTVSCKHENTKYVEIDGFPAYHQYDEKQHIYDVQYKEVCTNPNCGKTVNNIVDSKRIYEYQDHRFDENGKCQDCGYIKAENQVALEVVVSRGQATAKTGETISASAAVTGGDGNYKYSWKVLCDGSELITTDLGMGDSYNWKAEKAGKYIFTATVVDGNNDSKTASSQEIVVSESECAHEKYTDIPGTVTYEQVSDAKHNKITHMSRVCDVCKETISEYKKTESEDHTFENGKCTGCGIAEPTKDCAHEHTEEVFAGSEITGQGNTEQHIRSEKYNVMRLH